MRKFTIDRLAVDEWDRYRTIRLRALEDSPDAFGSTLEEEQAMTDADWQDRLGCSETATFVARHSSGKDVGLAVGAPYDAFAGLYGMWVSPDFRGLGIGGVLIDSVINWAKSSSYRKVLLDVGDYNTSAIALYDKMGFVSTGVFGSLPAPRDSITEHQRELVLIA